MIRIWALIFVFVTSRASGGLIGSPEKLKNYGGDSSQVSVSGLSAGGFMAVQVHVAYSEMFMGVGVVAGGPFYCAWANLGIALTSCMVSPENIKPNYLEVVTDWTYTFTRTIDDTRNMANDKVYLYTGSLDETVVPGVVDKLEEYYRAFVDPNNIKMKNDIPSGHAFVTTNYGNACSAVSRSPYISDCDYNQAYEILDHIYGPGLAEPDAYTVAAGEFLEFDQTEFQPSSFKTGSLDDVGFMYVPSGCSSQSSTAYADFLPHPSDPQYSDPLFRCNKYDCRVHVSLHGCKQGRSFLGNEYALHTGYNEVAELNNIIVIYPQVVPSLSNPNGCFDWWGYTGLQYACNLAPQMKAIKAMVDRVLY